MKAKTAYVCSECGAVALQWFGSCPSCGAAGTLSEHELGEILRFDLFYTPPKSSGVHNHYDREDVLVIQIEGEKEWHLTAPTVALTAPASSGTRAISVTVTGTDATSGITKWALVAGTTAPGANDPIQGAKRFELRGPANERARQADGFQSALPAGHRA